MQVQHPSSSGNKATTPPTFKPARRLVATAVIGAALIGYLVHKTAEARVRLESLTTMAQAMGDLTESDAALVGSLIANTYTEDAIHE